jgi:serine/threonine-protein kinase
MAFFCIHCRSEIDPKYKACPFCGEPITDFLRNHLEAPLDGKYQILSRLGVGGMGEVYKVLHLHLNSIRVIKLMRASITADPGAHERFQREARMATRINHPNVAALFDFSTLPDGSRYMVWEHIEGTNLHELIDARGPLSPRYAAKLAIEALHGLDAIHRAGIVHRDMSPENLMIARDEEGEEHVKIIDLGIAKQWSEEADEKTKTGMFVGKWKYCSPEQLGMLNAGERIDGRADLYSFGIVLYEMLTGVPPFQADTPHAYLLLHASERPRALREANPSVTTSRQLEALIFRAMEKDRSKRFASAREFAQALEAILPTLDDKPGAAAVPASSVPTEEITRAPMPIAPDGPTVATPKPDEIELAGEPLVETSAVPRDRIPRPPGKRSRAWLAIPGVIVVAVIIAAAMGGAAMFRKHDEPVAPKAPPISTSTVNVTAARDPRAQAHLGINAFPWAGVTSIRNLADGSDVKIDPSLVTPVLIDLPPGKYAITLANPDFRDPITRTVLLKAGSDQTIEVPFSNPATAPIPSFGGGQ